MVAELALLKVAAQLLVAALLQALAATHLEYLVLLVGVVVMQQEPWVLALVSM